MGFYVAQALLARAEPSTTNLQLADSMWLKIGPAGPRAAGGRPLHLCVAYMPDCSKPRAEVGRAYAQLTADVSAMQALGAEVVLLGDFNARVGSADQPGARTGQYGEQVVTPAGRDLCALLDCCDLYALNGRHPAAAPAYTRRKPNRDGTVEQSVLDYILVDSTRFAAMQATPQAQRAQVESDCQLAGTDHLLVWATLPGFDARGSRAAQRQTGRARPDVAKLRQPPAVIDGEKVEAPEVQAYQRAMQAESAAYLHAVGELRARVGAGEKPASEAARAAKHMLVSAMMRAVESSIGFRTPRADRRPGQPWWGPEVADAVHAKRAAAAAFRTAPSPQTALSLHQALRHTKEAIRAAKRAAREAADKALNDTFEETTGARHCPSGTKRFWGKLNALHRRRPTPGARSLERADGSVTADPAAIAELFAAHNECVGDPQRFAHGAGFSDTRKRAVERAVRQQLVSSHTATPDTSLDGPVQGEEVDSAIAQLHNGKAASPNDDVSCELLKKGGEATRRMLLALFSLQWDLEACARTPGVITELHKGGGKPTTKTDSYRPIQLLSVIDKCYDRMLNNRLTKHLEQAGRLHEAQNAFRRGRDCLEHVLTLHTVAQRRREQGLDTFFFFNDQEKAYDTAWRLAIVHKLWDKGVQGKMLRVISGLLANTTASVSQGGARSREFIVTQGVEQGGTLSPTLFNVFVDDLLAVTWANCAGVPIERCDGSVGKLVSVMFADDFAAVTASEGELQALVDQAHTHYADWRMKANVPKCAVMVVRGKGAAERRQAPLQIRWGGAAGPLIPQVESYTYMGVTLHASCKWDAQLLRAKDKTWGAANALASLLRTRGTSADVKRMASVVLLRPTTEWGAGVWRLTRSDMPRLDSLQADILKTSFHCPATICHSALLLELGLRPMSLWCDKRLLEFWHRVRNMEDSRIVKQVVLGASGVQQQARARGGARQRTWLDHVAEALHEWGIDMERAASMNYSRFKHLLHKTLPRVWERRLAAERATKPTLDAYMSRFAAGRVSFECAMPYLRGAGACNRGLELVLQLRTGSLPLACLTGKFGRSRRDDPSDTSHNCCPVCSSGEESACHFLLECPKYDLLRREMWRRLEAAMAPGRWNALRQMPNSIMAVKLLDCDYVGGSTVADVVAPFVYACWQLRWKVRNEESRSDERGADGSDAMA